MVTRKQFLRSALELGAATFGLVVLQACSSKNATPNADAPRNVDAPKPLDAPAATADAPIDAPSTPPNCLMKGTNTTIQLNHGHVLIVSVADITAAVDKTYDITGGALHSHMVTITAAQFASLAANTAIMTTSTLSIGVGGHTHGILVACL
jgi:hypothetical protein